MDRTPDESAPMSVLVVEDDDADALLVAEHFADAEALSGLTIALKRARTVAEVTAHAVDAVDCVPGTCWASGPNGAVAVLAQHR